MVRTEPMKRRLIVSAVAAASLLQAANTTAAQTHASKLHMLRALERMAAPAADANEPIFTRSASVSVAGKVQIVSPGVVGPLFCSMQFFYSDPNTHVSHGEAKSVPIVIAGKTGTCSIKVPF